MKKSMMTEPIKIILNSKMTSEFQAKFGGFEAIELR